MRRATSDISDLAAKRRWTEADGRAAVEAWRRSGRAPREFARVEGIHPVRLSRWARRFARPMIAPVEVIAASPPAVAPIEVALPSGLVLRVAPDFDEAALRRLLAALEPAC